MKTLVLKGSSTESGLFYNLISHIRVSVPKKQISAKTFKFYDFSGIRVTDFLQGDAYVTKNLYKNSFFALSVKTGSTKRLLKCEIKSE